MGPSRVGVLLWGPMGRYLRTLVIVVATMFLATSCAHRQQMSREQRRECRRLRTKAALAGVGVTVGMAVVATAIVVIAVASRGNVGSGSSGGGSRRRARRRERRERRHQVCYEAMESAPSESPEEEAEPVVAPVPPPAQPSQPTRAMPEPPSEEALAATFERIEPKVRECLGVGPVVEVDVAIEGQSGRVTGYTVHGMSVTPDQSACLIHQLQRMRFQPFQDELRVRFALDLSWVPPAPGTAPPQPTR